MPDCARHILLAGPPGCGKTTVVQKVVDRLGDLRLAGFYTREIRRTSVDLETSFRYA